MDEGYSFVLLFFQYSLHPYTHRLGYAFYRYYRLFVFSFSLSYLFIFSALSSSAESIELKRLSRHMNELI